MEIKKLKWIPWRRYVLFLSIDDREKIKIDRLPRKDTAAREVERLSVFKGYSPEVYDTKIKKIIFPLKINEN